MVSLRLVVASLLLNVVSSSARPHHKDASLTSWYVSLPDMLEPTGLPDRIDLVTAKTVTVYATPTTTVPFPEVVETVRPSPTPVEPPRDVLRELMAAPPDGKRLQIVGLEPQCWGTAFMLLDIDEKDHLLHVRCEQEIAALPRESKVMWAADLLPQTCQMTAERNWVDTYDPNPVTGFFHNKPADPLPAATVHPCTQDILGMTDLMRQAWVDGAMPPQCPLPWVGHEHELLQLEAATKVWCQIVTDRLLEIANPYAYQMAKAAEEGSETATAGSEAEV